MPFTLKDLPAIEASTQRLIEAIDATFVPSNLPKRIGALLTTIRAAFDKEGPKGSKVTRKEFEAIRARLQAILTTAVKEKTPDDLRLVWGAAFDLLHTLKTAWVD